MFEGSGMSCRQKRPLFSDGLQICPGKEDLPDCNLVAGAIEDKAVLEIDAAVAQEIRGEDKSHLIVNPANLRGEVVRLLLYCSLFYRVSHTCDARMQG